MYHRSLFFLALFSSTMARAQSFPMRNLGATDASFIQGRWQAVGGYFAISGDADPLLYGGDPVSGSVNGSPDSRGYVVQGSYFPWRNVDLQLQYIAYQKFNGASKNYDGFERDASDNDTLYLLAWFLW